MRQHHATLIAEDFTLHHLLLFLHLPTFYLTTMGYHTAVSAIPAWHIAYAALVWRSRLL